MAVLEVKIIKTAPETGHKFEYVININQGVLARRTAYFKDDVLTRDIDNKSLIKLVKKEITSYEYKRRVVNLIKEI